jgi:large subunit ribosomal protein L6e
MVRKTKNTELIPGIGRLSRSAAYRARAGYKVKKAKTPAVKKTVATTKEVPVKGDKNGKTRKVAIVRASRVYPTEDVKPRTKRTKKANPTKLRSSITPGTVLVLLVGRFRGKRVVFLKQLPSGLLLVTGPYKVNGVPLRRVNQAYVIATSTKVPIGAVDAKFTDDYFKRPAATKTGKDQEDFLAGAAQKTPIDASRISDQKAADKSILDAIKKVPQLKQYLGAHFTLSSGQYPHEMRF